MNKRKNHADFVVAGRPQRGFTLIELLVVIAIIALLVSILLPSLNKAKELARAVVCATTEKNIGIMSQLFAQENEEHLPYNQTGHGWSKVLSQYGDIDKFEPFKCPSDDLDRVGPPILAIQTTARSYALCMGLWDYTISSNPQNLGATSRDGSCTLTMIPKPAETLFLAEDHAWGNYCEGSSGGGINGYFTSFLFHTYHDGASNYLFCDGHVQKYCPDEYQQGWATIYPED